MLIKSEVDSDVNAIFTLTQSDSLRHLTSSIAKPLQDFDICLLRVLLPKYISCMGLKRKIIVINWYGDEPTEIKASISKSIFKSVPLYTRKENDKYYIYRTGENHRAQEEEP